MITYLLILTGNVFIILQSIETRYSGSESPLPFANSEVFHASIIQWRRLTASEGDCKAVYEVTFDVEVNILFFLVSNLNIFNFFFVYIS